MKWKYKVHGTFTYQFLNHCDRNGSYCLRYQIKNFMKNYLKTVCYYICVFFQSWPYQMSCQYSQHGLPMQLAFRKYHENVTDRTLNRWTPPLIHPPLYTLLIKPCNDSSRNATHTGTDFDKRYQLKFQINIQIIVEFTLLLFFLDIKTLQHCTVSSYSQHWYIRCWYVTCYWNRCMHVTFTN